MDIKVLQYFLAVAREESISGAAERLHMTQPPLSRQLKELEIELGKQLFIRGNRKITLTSEGMILRKRAAELVELMEKTKAEIITAGEDIRGNIYIGSGETQGMRLLAKTIKKMQIFYPNVHYHLYSGNAYEVAERLDRGLIDFGTFIEPIDLSKYDYIGLPGADIWGILMKKDHPLASLDVIHPKDLLGIPLLCSRQMLNENGLSGWLGYNYEHLNIIATYNLINTPALMVEEGIGCALCFDNIINLSGNSPLCFRPLEPRLDAEMYIVWKKYQIFTPATEKFLEFLHVEFE